MRGAAETLWKIQRALEAAGVEFIPADEAKGPGVRLKDRGASGLRIGELKSLNRRGRGANGKRPG
jgi:hypothetical protein